MLGRPWLATVAAKIDCRVGGMTISNGVNNKHLSLYPPTQPVVSKRVWVDESNCPSMQGNLASLEMVVIKQHMQEPENELENNMQSITIDSSDEELLEVEKILGHDPK